MEHTRRFLDIVNDAKSKIQETNVQEVWQRLQAGEKLLLIDVREESEFAAAHIEGAVYLGKGLIERDIESMVPDTDQEMILYCGGGYRSAIAAESLQRMGYTKAISMDGGFSGWAQAGLPMTVPPR